jgi:hypothetical protein
VRHAEALTSGQELALVVAADGGSGHVQVQAARLVFELAGKATEDDDSEDELGYDLRWEDMTPEQRAVARAELTPSRSALLSVSWTGRGTVERGAPPSHDGDDLAPLVWRAPSPPPPRAPESRACGGP